MHGGFRARDGNLIPGLANALADCSPVVAIGGSSPISQRGRGVFQEIDQVALAQPVTKWAERVYEASRIPELVHKARKIAVGGCPGPVYLDLPFDVLSEQVRFRNWMSVGMSRLVPVVLVRIQFSLRLRLVFWRVLPGLLSCLGAD